MKIKIFEKNLEKVGGEKVSLDYCLKYLNGYDPNTFDIHYLCSETFDIDNLYGIYLLPNKIIDKEAIVYMPGWFESFIFVSSKDGENISQTEFYSSLKLKDRTRLDKIFKDLKNENL